MVFAVALAWIAAVYRIRITASGPYTLWRLSFTAAITLVALGGTFFVFPDVADQLSPNLSSLLVHSTTVLACGCVLIYLLTLNYHEPSTMLVHCAAGSAAVVVVVQAAAWSISPIHVHDVTDLGDARPNWALLGYFISYYVYLGIVQAVTSASCIRQAKTNRTYDRSARAGLLLIAAATFIGAIAIGGYAVRVTLSLTSGPDYEALSRLGDDLAPVAYAGIAAGTVIFILGPRVSAWAEARRTIRQLRPLHARLRSLYPEIAIDLHRGQPVVYKERMLIEIHDGLQRATVAKRPSHDPYRAIADALEGPSPAGHRGTPASQLLPPISNRDDERAVLLTLADTLQETHHA